MKPFWTVLSLMLAFTAPLGAQEAEAPPVLHADASVPAPGDARSVFRVRPDRPGLYRLTLDGPGVLRLLDHPTVDGLPSGETAPRALRSAASFDGPVSLGPVLLSADRSYLVSAAPVRGADASLAMTPVEVFDAVTDPGEAVPEGAEWSALYRIDGKTALAWEGGAGAEMEIEAITEPRAAFAGHLDGIWLPPGGRWSWRRAEGGGKGFSLAPTVSDGGAAPLVYLSAGPVRAELDEVEPNYHKEGGAPTPWDMAIPFRSALMPIWDFDVLEMTVDTPLTYAITVEGGVPLPYLVSLARIDEGGKARELTRRKARDGAVRFTALSFDPGRYQLTVWRDDKNLDPVPYTVSAAPAVPPRTGVEREPNDTAVAAQPLGDAGLLRGDLGSDDPAVARFSIEKEGHLWRLMGLGGATRMILEDMRGRRIFDHKGRSGRLTADALALSHGDYRVALYGEGAYALRLLDLGAAPDGYEAEPNDTAGTAARLLFGAPRSGAFHRASDHDAYVFRLDRKAGVALTINPPDDGQTKMWLEHDRTQFGKTAVFPPGSMPYTWRGTLPTGDYVLWLRGDTETMRDSYSLTLDRLGAEARPEPDTVAGRLRAMPRSGQIDGRLGGIDHADRLHVALPEGEGEMIAGCAVTGPDPVSIDWRFYAYGDDEYLLRAGLVPEVVPYSPALGGAVRMMALHGGRDVPYDCFTRFMPETLPDPAAVKGDGPHGLAPGTALSGIFADAKARPVLTLDLPPGAAGMFSCTGADDAPLATLGNVERFSGIKPGGTTVAGARALRAPWGDAASVTLRGDYAKKYPYAWSCALLGVDDLRSPTEMGPPAEFTAIALRTPPEKKEAEATRVPVEPLLKPGRPDWIPDDAPGGDLPVTMAVSGLETPFAPYAQAGQRARVAITATNTGETPLDVTLDARMLAEGWTVERTPVTHAIAPGDTVEASFDLVAPPMLSPVLQPAFTVAATAGGARTVMVADVALDLSAPARDPLRHWSVPVSLRGGMNVLDRAFGARIVSADGTAWDEKKAAKYGFVHDGLAPHSAAGKSFSREIVFRLADTAPVAGAVFHLRSSDARANWPVGYAIALSADGEAWEMVATGDLSASHARQFVPFDAPREAAFLRLRVPGCQGDRDCAYVVLQEVQAIAEPNWRFGEPLDIARLDLGGHVVRATEPLGGNWNASLLEGAKYGRKLREKNDDRWPDPVDAVVGFHLNRAARVARIEWHGTDRDAARFEGVPVAVSLEGPDGPWREIGTLPSPPSGAAGMAALDLPEPVWARYLRLRFARHPENSLAVPARIAILEAPDGPSVQGLWEDDRQQAGYEAERDTSPPAPVPVRGGPDGAGAVPLPLDERIDSSVLLERNEDWWALDVPEGPPQALTLDFHENARGRRGEYVATLLGPGGAPVPLSEGGEAVLSPGRHLLRVHEPPRSIVIGWDTSGSVGAYIPRTLEAVRLWARSLRPGRTALQLIPFGDGPVLPDWAERPEDVIPFLATLPMKESSDAETMLMRASEALAERDGARGIVVITDAETSSVTEMWPALLEASPRVVSLSIDSSGRENATAMMDWSALNGGLFHRVVGTMGLADGLDMAAALFAAPKPYAVTATLVPYEEPEGEAVLSVSAAQAEEATDATPAATGAVQVILDASGSMLKRMDGRRRITVAHDALAALATETLPAGVPFAFRAFGLEKDACRSDLLIPLGPLDPAGAEAAIRAVPAINLAKTAIAASLLQARDDLAKAAPPRVLVLVTDGEETCEGDVEAAIDTLRADGFDVRVNIVGFAIDDAALASTFAGWARRGGGTYFDAQDADALSDAVARAIAPRFAVIRERLDGTEERVGTLDLGMPLTVPAGSLRIEPAGGATGAPLRLRMAPDGTVALVYDAGSGIRAAP